MAKKKYVPVRMDGEIFESVKKVALSQGRSVSETVGMLVMKSLDSGQTSSLGIDPAEIKKIIKETILEGTKGGTGAEKQMIAKVAARVEKIVKFLEEFNIDTVPINRSKERADLAFKAEDIFLKKANGGG